MRSCQLGVLLSASGLNVQPIRWRQALFVSVGFSPLHSQQLLKINFDVNTFKLFSQTSMRCCTQLYFLLYCHLNTLSVFLKLVACRSVQCKVLSNSTATITWILSGVKEQWSNISQSSSDNKSRYWILAAPVLVPPVGYCTLIQLCGTHSACSSSSGQGVPAFAGRKRM